jgi:hypothetical protein
VTAEPDDLWYAMSLDQNRRPADVRSTPDAALGDRHDRAIVGSG